MVRQETQPRPGILDSGTNASGDAFSRSVQAHLRLTIHRSRTPLMGFPGGHEGT